MRQVFIVTLLTAVSACQGARSSRLAFVSNEMSHDVSVVDLSTSAVVATIPIVGRPRGIQTSPDGRTVYVTSSDAQPGRESNVDGIVAIDVATRKVRTMFHVGTDPEQFGVTPDGERLYASNEDGGTATAVDTRTGKFVATLVVGIEPEGVAISPDGRWAAVT